MSRKKIPEKVIWHCDGCNTYSERPHRPDSWSHFTLTRAALDFQGQAVADASIHLDFCLRCSDDLVELLNKWKADRKK